MLSASAALPPLHAVHSFNQDLAAGKAAGRQPLFCGSKTNPSFNECSVRRRLCRRFTPCIHYTSKSCFCQPVFLGNRLPRLAGTVGILRRETRPLHRCFGENAASDKSTFKILQNRNFCSLDRYAILLWVISIDRRGIFLCPRQKSRLSLARRLFAICAF